MMSLYVQYQIMIHIYISSYNFFFKCSCIFLRSIIKLSYCRLFKQYMLLVLINQMVSALLWCIVALGRSLIVLSKFGSFALLILFALGGSVLSRGKDCKFEIYLSQNLKQDLYPLWSRWPCSGRRVTGLTRKKEMKFVVFWKIFILWFKRFVLIKYFYATYISLIFCHSFM